MTSEYDDITAFHYASYRPPLHIKILERCLGDESFDSGLDIGCGTGKSSIALGKFCNSVVGIDPSAAMISQGIKNPNLSYQLFDKSRIPFPENTFDIVTLAGSLWYAKSQLLLDEIIRVGNKNAVVLIYDFEVLFEDILLEIGLVKSDDANPYKHEEDFSGLNANQLMQPDKSFEKLSVPIKISDLVHLILSVKEQYTALANLYGDFELYDILVQKLNLSKNQPYFEIQADTFSTLYRIN